MTTAQLDKRIDDILRFDPLERAEEISGGRVEDGGPAFALGLAFVQEQARLKEDLLRTRGDVWEGCPLSHYIACIEAYGFMHCLEEEFGGRDGEAERFFIYAHPDGLLLTFHTYAGDHINSGNVYYNWHPRDDDQWAKGISSGGYVDWDRRIWAGDHGAREALIFNLDRLRSLGEFVTPWVKRPFLWLLHYREGYDHEAINEARIQRLPAWARQFIGSAEQ